MPSGLHVNTFLAQCTVAPAQNLSVLTTVTVQDLSSYFHIPAFIHNLHLENAVNVQNMLH